jgi:hypothetical protein
MNFKTLESIGPSVSTFAQDVHDGATTTYAIADFPNTALKSFYPDKYLEKCSCVHVTLSSCPSNGWDYLLMAPQRLDETRKSGFVYDLDPFIIAFREQNFELPTFGVIGYHLIDQFEGRTTKILGLTSEDYSNALAELRSSIATQSYPTSAADNSHIAAMHYMAKQLNNIVTTHEPLPILATDAREKTSND